MVKFGSSDCQTLQHRMVFCLTMLPVIAMSGWDKGAVVTTVAVASWSLAALVAPGLYRGSEPPSLVHDDGGFAAQALLLHPNHLAVR